MEINKPIHFQTVTRPSKTLVRASYSFICVDTISPVLPTFAFSRHICNVLHDVQLSRIRHFDWFCKKITTNVKPRLCSKEVCKSVRNGRLTFRLHRRRIFTDFLVDGTRVCLARFWICCLRRFHSQKFSNDGWDGWRMRISLPSLFISLYQNDLLRFAARNDDDFVH